jgi:hypothetical protein
MRLRMRILKQILQKNFSKLIIFFILSIPATHSYSKVVSIDVCQRMVADLSNQFPQKRKLFTTLKPECISETDGRVLLRLMLQANKNNEPADNIREAMVRAASDSLKKVVCHQKEYSDLVQLIDIRFAFKLEESESVITYFDISYETCNNESKKTVDLGVNFGVEACQKHVASNKNNFPRKLSENLTATGLECRKGQTKETALVFFQEFSGVTVREFSSGITQNKKSIKDALKSSYCTNGLTKGLLKVMDISIAFKVKEQEVESIFISEKDCD